MSDMLEEPRAGERLLASACRFLADGGNEELARLLATCSARVRPVEELIFGGTNTVLEVFLTAPRAAYDVLTSNDDEWAPNDERCELIFRALRAPIPTSVSHRITVLAELIEPEENWRAEYGATVPNEPPLPSPPQLLPASDGDVLF